MTVDVGSEALSQYRETTIQELLDKYDIVGAGVGNASLGWAPHIVVSERGTGITTKLASSPNIDAGFGLQELGYTSMSPWTAWTREEMIPELRNKQGIRKYYDMKRNDGAVRGSLRLLKTPIQAAHWFIEPASDSALDKNIAEFVEDCLFRKMNVDWSQVLDDVLLMFDYGYMVFEKVYDFDLDGKLILKKLAPRHPLDIQEWVFDDHGGPSGIVMEPFVPYGNKYIQTAPSDQFGIIASLGQFIPINKLAIFSVEPEAGDLRGISVLRSAYKHWYYKDTLYKIDAIQKERHGIGVPVIKLPPGFTTDDKKLADELGRNLRTNDRAHIVVPANWEIMFAVLGGQPVSCIESINHHNGEILLNVLATFIGDAKARDVSADMFLKSTRYLANGISNIFNKHIIQQLVDLNFKRGKYPRIRARRIGEWDDLRTLSFAVRNFVGAGLITPDDVLEASLREESDLPKMDKATQRLPPAPQAPGQTGAPGEAGPAGDANVPAAPKPPTAGPPRQAPPSAAPAKANAGRDGSGK
jgi:hypothetical protein